MAFPEEKNFPTAHNGIINEIKLYIKESKDISNILNIKPLDPDYHFYIEDIFTCKLGSRLPIV